MKHKIAKRWVEALRSGKYKQTVGRLRDSDDGFCCLGVLCNLHAEDHPEIAASETNPLQYLETDLDLPSEVRFWANLESRTGWPRSGNSLRIGCNHYGSLAAANDGGRDFDEIADWIEQNYKDL